VANLKLEGCEEWCIDTMRECCSDMFTYLQSYQRRQILKQNAAEILYHDQFLINILIYTFVNANMWLEPLLHYRGNRMNSNLSISLTRVFPVESIYWLQILTIEMSIWLATDRKDVMSILTCSNFEIKDFTCIIYMRQYWIQKITSSLCTVIIQQCFPKRGYKYRNI
jgi:hypothetical protein